MGEQAGLDSQPMWPAIPAFGSLSFRRAESRRSRGKNSGDRFLAVFESPIDALKGTAELQQKIAIQQNRRRL
jgi:hypothetical protein